MISGKDTTCYEVQAFGGNSVSTYKNGGLKGHTGIDVYCGYGTDVISDFDGFVYKVLDVNHPSRDGSGFTGVFMIVDTPFETFEWLVGHINPTVEVGTRVKKGDKIGTEANHGEVYSGGERITLEMQASGDHRGSHRHCQKRAVKRVTNTLADKYYLTSMSDTTYNDGNYYETYDFYNGYNGCVDPLLPVFSRDLYYSSSGYDVFCLQKFLGVEQTGFFGIKTLIAVIHYQNQNNITPALGYVGQKTRASFNL